MRVALLALSQFGLPYFYARHRASIVFGLLLVAALLSVKSGLLSAVQAGTTVTITLVGAIVIDYLKWLDAEDEDSGYGRHRARWGRIGTATLAVAVIAWSFIN